MLAAWFRVFPKVDVEKTGNLFRHKICKMSAAHRGVVLWHFRVFIAIPKRLVTYVRVDNDSPIELATHQLPS
jgi:hypothetical protein